jgi:glutathione S-transferase/predicted esterase
MMVQGTLILKDMQAKTSLSALKCIVASSFCRQSIEIRTDDDSSSMAFEFMVTTAEKTSLERLTDPLAITWHLSQNEAIFGCRESREQSAQAWQWNFFALSQVNPFLHGYVHNCRGVLTRDVIYQQKQRLAQLSKGLNVLNDYLGSKTFLVGERITFADTNLAIDMIPLFKTSINGKLLIDEVGGGGGKVINLRRWYDTIVNQGAFLESTNISKLALNVVGAVESNLSTKAPPKNETQPRQLKVLCLHGYRQTSTSFYEKLGAFRKMVGKKCQMTLVNAPHVVPADPEDAAAQEQRGWWFSQPHGYFKSNDVSACDKGFEESLAIIKKTIEEDGPFDGLMGFSQGAALAVLIGLLQSRGEASFSCFKFAMIFAPFKSACSRHDYIYEGTKIDIPTMVVIGEGDQVIEASRSESLLAYFSRPEVVRHPGGHFVPATSKQKQSYLYFLDRF